MYAILAKAKLTTAQEVRLLPAFAKAAEMKNACLDLQFTRAAEGERLNSNIDLRNAFRTFSFGSDYKDQIADRVCEQMEKRVRRPITQLARCSYPSAQTNAQSLHRQ